MPRKPATDANPHLVQLKGRRAFYIRWTEPGSRRSQVVSTGTEDEAEARLVLADFKIARHAPPPNPTVTWYLDERAKDFKVEGPKGERTEPRIASFHKALKAFFGDYRPDQLSNELVRDYLAMRPDTSGRREVEELRAAIPEKLRVCDFKLPAQRPPREKFLTREQAKAILDKAHAYHVRLFILIAMTTGQRSGAILGLTWDRVLWDSSVLDFRDPERGENRKRRGVCPVDKRVMDALRDAREIATTDWVIEFGAAPVDSVKKAFKRAAVAAGVPWASPHALKHSVISWLAMDGWTVDAIADFTSTDEKTVKRIYRKVNPGYLRELADDLANGIFGEAEGAGIKAPKRNKSKHRARKPSSRATGNVL
jgi:integrase